jgi:hypothetical protein
LEAVSGGGIMKRERNTKEEEEDRKRKRKRNTQEYDITVER